MDLRLLASANDRVMMKILERDLGFIFGKIESSATPSADAALTNEFEFTSRQWLHRQISLQNWKSLNTLNSQPEWKAQDYFSWPHSRAKPPRLALWAFFSRKISLDFHSKLLHRVRLITNDNSCLYSNGSCVRLRQYNGMDERKHAIKTIHCSLNTSTMNFPLELNEWEVERHWLCGIVSCAVDKTASIKLFALLQFN